MTTEPDFAFMNDCLNKQDVVIRRLTDERDRWRSVLVDIVGERVAEMKYREALSQPLRSLMPGEPRRNP